METSTPKIELIVSRSYGEKLNELTSLVYDNFGPVVRYAKWYLLVLGVVLAAIVQYFPEEGAWKWLRFCSLFLLIMLYIIFMIILMRRVGVEQCHYKGVNDFLRQAMPTVLRILPTLVLPMVLFGTLGTYLFGLVSQTSSSNAFTFGLLLFLILSLFILVASPLLMLANIAVFEEKSGFDALGRTFSLLKVHPIPTFVYYLTIAFIALILPEIAELPYMIYSNTIAIVTDEYMEHQDPTFFQEVMQMVFATLTALVFVFYFAMLALAMLLEYGNVVEKLDNVSFNEKFKNFDNL